MKHHAPFNKSRKARMRRVTRRFVIAAKWSNVK